jgi:hypothetical protein
MTTMLETHTRIATHHVPSSAATKRHNHTVQARHPLHPLVVPITVTPAKTAWGSGRTPIDWGSPSHAAPACLCATTSGPQSPEPICILSFCSGYVPPTAFVTQHEWLSLSCQFTHKRLVVPVARGSGIRCITVVSDRHGRCVVW